MPWAAAPARHPNTSASARRVGGDCRPLAAEFYRLTGKPLGVTGEVAEYVAAKTLGLRPETPLLCPKKPPELDLPGVLHGAADRSSKDVVHDEKHVVFQGSAPGENMQLVRADQPDTQS